MLTEQGESKKKINKFNVGDKINFKRTKNANYANQTGVVVEVESGFKEIINESGVFDPDGLLTLERTIESIRLPFEFDGWMLKVFHPETNLGEYVQKAYTRTAIFYGFYYSIRIAGFGYLLLWEEDQLELA